MTRLRFIVDRPRGKRGGHHDERHLYTSRSGAKRALGERTERAYQNRVIRAARPAGKLLVVDLDALLPDGADVETLFSWHEAQSTHHAAEAMRLMPHVQRGDAAAWLTTTDLDELREVVAEWDLEEDRLRRGGGATPAAARAFFLLRDLLRAGKLGRRP